MAIDLIVCLAPIFSYYLTLIMNSILSTFKVKAIYYLPFTLFSLLSSQRINKMEKKNKSVLTAAMFCKRTNKADQGIPP